MFTNCNLLNKQTLSLSLSAGETEASLEKGRRSKVALRRGRRSTDAIVHFRKIEAEAVKYPAYLEGDSHSRNSSAGPATLAAKLNYHF